MSVSKYSLFFLSLLLLVSNGVIFGQSNKAKQIDEFVMQFARANQFGGQILVADKGKVIYEKAFGLANADFKIPNQLNTRIGIASITKLMTAVILFRLVEEKKISLADKLIKYIPGFPNGDKISIEMLFKHRAGVPHRVMPSELESVSYTSAEFIEKVKKSKLDFEPGEERSYSSGGYSVLARALEVSSGKSYAHLLEEYVFAPAGLKDSVTFDGEKIMERRAQNYYPSPDGVINVPLKDYSFLVGAGSVFGTARDVYKFGKAVVDGKYGEASKTSLISGSTLRGSGSTNGHRAIFEIENDKKYGYVIVANMSGAFDSISQGLKEILQNKPLTVKYKPTPKTISIPSEKLNEFLGRYNRTGGAVWKLTIRNGFLYSGNIKLYPVRPDCFFEYRFFADVCFTRDESGKINEMSWKGANFELKGIKQ